MKINQNDRTKLELISEVNELRQRLNEIEKKQNQSSQEDLEQKEAIFKYKTLFENAPLSYQSLDDDGCFLDINSTWLDTLGYQREEVIGKKYGDFLHPDWQKHFEKNFPAFKKRGHVHNVQFKIRHKQGHYVDISFDGCIGYNPDGSFKQTYCVFKDITKQKKAETLKTESEKRYKALFENAGISIWNEDLTDIARCLEQLRVEGVSDLRQHLNNNPDTVLDIATKAKVVSVNNATLELFGVKTQQKFLEHIANCFGPGAHKVFIDELCAIWKKKSVFRSEVDFVTYDGRLIKAIISFHIPDTIEGFKSIPVSIIDITELKQAQEELLQSRKLESVGLLAGGIAHDFNNILTGLFGNIELAKNKLDSDHPSFSNIHTASSALEEATNLTKRLLTFSKGGDPLLEAVNIEQVITDSIKFSLSGSNIKTVLKLSENLWQVTADKGQLSQVITNMVINADQAMPSGGTLEIEAENINITDNIQAHDLSGDYVKLTINDQGHGIPHKHLNKIFDPYFSTKQSGSGLGLATVHSIINKHHGNIQVKSKLGKGSTFIIYFPAVKTLSKIKRIEPESEIKQRSSKKANILVMDDNDMILDFSRDILNQIGYSVDIAKDGKEALEKYISADKNGSPFDVVIMDLTIPGGMGGKETVKELLVIDPDAKVIVSSGYSTDPVMANFSEYGFNSRLTKPFQIKDLEQTISLLID